MNRKKLRIGLLLDSLNIPAWEFAMIERIKRSNYATISLIILKDESPSKNSGSFKGSVNFRYLLYYFYLKMIFNRVQSNWNAFVLRDLKDLITNISILHIHPEKNGSNCYIKDVDLKEIRSYNIDVFLNLGFNGLKGPILTLAKYGVWFHYECNEPFARSIPTSFWAVLDNKPVTGSTLCLISDNGEKYINLHESFASTYKFSIYKNCNRDRWKRVSYIPRLLESIYTHGKQKFNEILQCNKLDYKFNSNKPYDLPGNIEFLRKISILYLRKVSAWIFKIFYIDQWILLYDFSETNSGFLWKYKKLIPPKDRFWADPHVIYENGNYYIYIEELIYKTRKAHISLIVLDDRGKYQKPIKILDTPYHLSYPFLFKWNGDYYMIPETSKANNIQIYKCTKFPDTWEFQKNLMDNIEARDTTLFYYNERWWLFTSVVENKGYPGWDELYLYYADNPLSSNWTSHPRNPVISDVRTARPAGKIFKSNNIIYRPSQNSSKRYGYGLKVNQILILNENEYKEVEISQIEPSWDKNILAVHSFNIENGLTIIDGKLKRFRYL